MLVEGKLRVRIHSITGEAPPGFVPVKPTLEDAYLVLTSADGKARATSDRALATAGSTR
jgi:hypothetical protein